MADGRAGRDEWDGGETETYRELMGDSALSLEEPQCVMQDGELAASVLILNRPLSPSDARKFGLERQM